MNAIRSAGQPELIYVILTDNDAKRLRDGLRKSHPLADELRRKLKELLR